MTTPIRSLKPNEYYGAIEVRISRLWHNNDYTTGRLISLDCVLVDNEHEAIHGSIRAQNADYLLEKIVEGQIYHISNFNVAPNKQRYKITPHCAMLQFARATSFTPVADEKPDIPLYKFYFIEFDQLQSRTDINEVLTDVIGMLTKVQEIEQTNIRGKITSRRTLTLQNIRSEKLQVTLWGETAEKFDTNILKTIDDPVIVIFTSMAVKQYMGNIYVASTSATIYYINLDTAETKTLMTRFRHTTQQIDFVPASVKQIEPPEQQKQQNRKTIEELNKLNHLEHQGIKFTVKATIFKFETQQGWYYNSCHQCYKQVKEAGSGWWCDTHGHLTSIPTPWYKLNTRIQDETGYMMIVIFGKAAQALIKKSCSTLTIEEGYTDPTILPPMIEQLRGQTKIFQIYFRPRGALIDTVVSRIFDDDEDQPLLLPQPTTTILDPKTPTPKTVTPSVEAKTTKSSAKRKLNSDEDQPKKSKQKL